jgi:hypothetical protein
VGKSIGARRGLPKPISLHGSAALMRAVDGWGQGNIPGPVSRVCVIFGNGFTHRELRKKISAVIRPRAIWEAVSDRFRLWWRGRPFDNDQASGLVFMNHYQRHWTSRASHAAFEYCKAHHQWIIGLAVAVLVAVVVKMR